ncbi:MAG: hypothetical protein WCT40_00385 [Candidatus Magasanikbacteria bacterium]|jgi:tRNA A37 threonylcarbamoyladenosine modification protein TsaB
MRLLLDNSSNDTIVWMPENGEWFEFGQKLGVLAGLEALLKKKNVKLADVSGLAVVVGRGRFTSTRIAATVANTLAYALQIPIVAVNDSREKWLDKLSVQPVGQYISAQYSAEANIGKKFIE